MIKCLYSLVMNPCRLDDEVVIELLKGERSFSSLRNSHSHVRQALQTIVELQYFLYVKHLGGIGETAQ